MSSTMFGGRRPSTVGNAKGVTLAPDVSAMQAAAAQSGGEARSSANSAGGRRKSTAGRRKSVAGRRKSVVAKEPSATTPQELANKALEASGTKVGAMVWARLPPKAEEVYAAARVEGATSGARVNVKLPSGAVEEYAVSDLLPCNTDSDLADVCALTYLNEASVLDCVRTRFLAKKIYTWTARILISMNPFESRPDLYNADKMAEFAAIDPRAAPPHIFAVGEAAYRAISKKGKFRNQSIIVSGESGSGKTVGNKLLMDYFAYRSGSASASTVTAEIAKVMHDSNPVLEAFGNAKTTRNSNSSRFGKFQIMRFSDTGEIGTVTIATYLLEKSRVTSITDPERNYHVFYMLLAGGGAERLKTLELGSVPDFYYLNQSKCYAIPDWKDAEEFAIMDKALNVIGSDASRSEEIYTALAAVLHLGNVTFSAASKDGVEATVVSNPEVLAKVARRLGVDDEALTTMLTTRELKGPRGGAPIVKALSVSAAERGRDSISKALFVRVFDWLVTCMNATIKEVGARGADGGAPAEERFVGLVDLFGFESFKTNSFEQLCINYANEKLQQFFLQYVFYTEEAIHKEEGVTWPQIELPDNQGAIDLISAKDTGILFLLDGASRLQGAKEGTFFEQVNDTHKKNRFYKKPKGLRNDEGFSVKHYAGDVVYHSGCFTSGAEGVTWLDKNNYALAADQQRVLSTSMCGIVADLFEAPGGAEEPKPKPGGAPARPRVAAVRTGAKAFMSNLEELMKILSETAVQFVRCIKPCAEQRPGLASAKNVLNQLRCNGTMEAVEVMQAAYPSRIGYELIHGNVVGFLPEFMQQMRPNEFFEILMAALDIPRDKYQLGLTKLFMKTGVGRALEELAEMDVNEMVPVLLAKVTEFEKKKKAGIKIKARAMAHTTRKNYLLRKAAVAKIQRVHRTIHGRRLFRTFVTICLEVHRELKAAQEREEEERRQAQLELERQAAELRRQQEALKAQQAEVAAAEEEAKLAEQQKALASQIAIAQVEAMEAAVAAEETKAMAPGFERLLAANMLEEPDVGDRLSLPSSAGGDGRGSSASLEEHDSARRSLNHRMSVSFARMSAAGIRDPSGITDEIRKRVSMRMAEDARAKKETYMGMLEEDREDDDEWSGEESDEEEYDGLTLGGKGSDDKVFEVVVVRHETTGSLGLELDEYKGAPTVCAIMLGGPADQDGTLQMGDTVVAIDGKKTANMEDVKRAVISAASSSLRLAVLRKPVVVMRRERAYMSMPDCDDSEEWEAFEITLFSNRQLTFEKLSPPFVFGSIELPAAKSLRLMRVQYNVCLQIATAERTFEFYTDSLMTLYEWQRMLRGLMLSNTVSVMSGWLTLLDEQEAMLRRWWFDLCGSTFELCYFETDQCQALNLPAQGCIDLAEVRVVDLMSAEAVTPMLSRAGGGGAGTGDVREVVRLMCDVHRSDENDTIGIELSQAFEITALKPGSPSALSSLQIGDRLLAVDGHEVDTNPKRKKKKAVKELLKDLDQYPKQVHTFTVERTVPVVLQEAGAITIKAKAEHWIMYPCSADEVPLSAEEYHRALDQWLAGLRDSAKEAREAAEAAGGEQVLQQLWVELEEEDDWRPYYCTLSASKGLSFYDEKEDSIANPEAPLRALGLDMVRGAGRAPGIDFYDGVIDIEVYGQEMWRLRPSGHAAMHNLLSAINIYKVAPQPSQLPPAEGGTERKGMTQRLLSHRSGKSMGGSRKESVASSGSLTQRLFGRKQSTSGPAVTARGGREPSPPPLGIREDEAQSDPLPSRRGTLLSKLSFDRKKNGGKKDGSRESSPARKQSVLGRMISPLRRPSSAK